VEIRRAELSDAPAIADVHVRSWQAGYRGFLPDDLLDELSVERRRRDWETWLGSTAESTVTLVADDGDSLAGFCTVAVPARDDDAGPAAGELPALYVDPERWRSGMATRLLAAALDLMRERGCREATVWLLEGNAPALAAYAKHGFAPDGAVKREPVASLAAEESPPQVRLRAPLGG
jgi:GNAT superfamily N-acetyltransferase